MVGGSDLGVTAPDRDSLAERQAALVAALTSGAPVPEGLDPERIRIAAHALLHKRAAEVAGRWPLLAAGQGSRWHQVFTGWGDGRPTGGSLRDGFDLALLLEARGELDELGARELTQARARWIYDGSAPPAPRPPPRFSTLRRFSAHPRLRR